MNTPPHTPKISVVMPAYNAQEFITDAINSILAQTFTDFELIILNDGSTDNTVHIVKTFDDPRIRLIDNPTNKGLVAVLNQGLDIARGEYIARMDADDISLPERFAHQVAYMDTHPECGVCGVQAILFGDVTPMRGNNPASVTMMKLLRDNCIAHPGVMLRHSVMDAHHFRYDPEFVACEDYELWSRMVRHTKIVNLPEHLLKYRWHRGNVTQRCKAVQSANTARVKKRLAEELSRSFTPLFSL